jgi:hypothetical protein
MRKVDVVAIVILTGAAMAAVDTHPYAQGAPSADERVAALKASLTENQKRLRQYEWIETTIINLKGEEKARKQQRCYYGADGKIQKVPVQSEPAAQPSAGGRGRRGGRLKEQIVENKKEDMQDYMKRAGDLIHSYLPPNPVQIQQAKDGGKVGVKPLESGRVRLSFSGYLQPGDLLAIDIDGSANQLSAISLATYLDKPDDPVTLDVRYGSLPDGTSYIAQTTLDAKAKNIRVVVENSGHRPAGR